MQSESNSRQRVQHGMPKREKEIEVHLGLG